MVVVDRKVLPKFQPPVNVHQDSKVLADQEQCWILVRHGFGDHEVGSDVQLSIYHRHHAYAADEMAPSPRDINLRLPQRNHPVAHHCNAIAINCCLR